MCPNSVLPTLFHYTSPTPPDKNKRSWARLIILRETDIIKLFQILSSYQFSWILLMCPRYLPWHIYVPISLPLWIYLSHSVHLFLTDDVTALTCPLSASYLGYLGKYWRLFHCSPEEQVLNVTYWSVLEVYALHFYASPVMAERSALLVKMFFIPSSCRVSFRSIFCSTLNLNRWGLT